MLLKPIRPKILSVRYLPQAHESVILSYGGDPLKHTSLGLITVDQDDSTYVALDEATKHSPIDIIFAKSFYAGANHSSGRLSGEILGVMAGLDHDIVLEGMQAAIHCLEEDACFYSASETGDIAVFPHVISSLGYYLSKQAGLEVGSPMAYLVAPPMEASIGFDAVAKNANVEAVKIFPPPTETNYAAAWYKGDLNSCMAAAEIFAQTVIEVGNHPKS